MRDFHTLDVETASKDPSRPYMALEPWRIRQGLMHITSISIRYADGSVNSAHRSQMSDPGLFERHIESMLEDLAGERVYAHNSVFDLACLIATIQKIRCGRIPDVIRKIKWFDSMLLAKWVVNGQKAERIQFSYSLVNLAQNFLSDHPRIAEFVEMKTKPFDPNDTQYWEERNTLDVIMTWELAALLETHLQPSMVPGYATEAVNLVPVANSWITGIRIDEGRLKAVEQQFQNEMDGLIEALQISPSLLTSPKQLSEYLFVTLGLKPISSTAGGAPSTKADDIKRLAYMATQSGNEYVANQLNNIRRYKELSTLMSKYINGTKNALQHTGDGYIYGAPRIFGTYTGRFTYSSKTLDTYQTSLAMHQIPRKDKDIRSFLCPPHGFKVYEADASGQESRLMAIRSRDPVMIQVFQNNMDFHAMTGSAIVGMDYNELVRRYKAGEAQATEYRQLGKLTNLSCNYRTGGKTLSEKAFSDYDVVFSIDHGMYYVSTFARRYGGVPDYWTESIAFAKATGYTEAFGGRRYKIFDWTPKFRWGSESSSLMFPIQGSGASMKNVCIAELYQKVPDFTFALDLHDASFGWVPDDIATDVANQCDDVLDKIDYKHYWGIDLPISLPYDSKLGNSFADVK